MLGWKGFRFVLVGTACALSVACVPGGGSKKSTSTAPSSSTSTTTSTTTDTMPRFGAYPTGSTVISQPGRMDFFEYGFTDHTTWQRTYQNGSWNAWHSIGGNALYGELALSPEQGKIHLFIVGDDNVLRHAEGTGDSFTPWEQFDGWASSYGNLMTGAFGVSRTAGTLDVFVLTDQQYILQRHFDGTIWSGWTTVAHGSFWNTPYVLAWGSGRIDIFGTGFNTHLYHVGYNGTAWSAVEDLGANLDSTGAVVSPDTSRLELFVRGAGADFSLYHRVFNGSSWGSWEFLSTNVWSVSPNDVVSRAPGTIDLALDTTTNTSLLYSYSGGTWSGPTRIDNASTTGWERMAPMSATKLEIITNDNGRATIYHRELNGSTLSSWQNLGAP